MTNQNKYNTLIINHSQNIKFKKQSIVNLVSNLELHHVNNKPMGMTFFLHIIKFQTAHIILASHVLQLGTIESNQQNGDTWVRRCPNFFCYRDIYHARIKIHSFDFSGLYKIRFKLYTYVDYVN